MLFAKEGHELMVFRKLSYKLLEFLPLLDDSRSSGTADMITFSARLDVALDAGTLSSLFAALAVEFESLLVECASNSSL